MQQSSPLAVLRASLPACLPAACLPLQTGQFLGARGDFVPEQICRKLSLLHDQVGAAPGMAPSPDGLAGCRRASRHPRALTHPIGHVPRAPAVQTWSEELPSWLATQRLPKLPLDGV